MTLEQQLRSDIRAQEKALKNPLIPEGLKRITREDIKLLKKQLAQMEAKPTRRAKVTATGKKAAARKLKPKAKTDKPEPKPKPAEPKPKPKAVAPKAKPKAEPKAVKPKAAPKAKKPKKTGMSAPQNYISKLSKRATAIQRAGGMKDNESCQKKVFKVNRADAMKQAAKEIRFDAGKYDADNKNRSGMDGTKKKRR